MARNDVLLELEEELQILIRKSRVAARGLASEVHPRLDRTAYPMLALLTRHPAMRISDIATALLLDKSTVSRQIDAAARLGLVSRVPDPTDARARLIELDPDAAEVIRRQRAERRSRLRDALSDWDSEELEELVRLLRKLYDSGL
ncbi:DNA-binding MarR family transcriptional regulator [Stackebrandtia albiflava]|uniref:DNA-binding MarR family transcriptional regulator n=1 Tax=Stackebrandtia albiflava TaxID=406432 RepID=A0A562V9N2_9ACTN|nr:MarR family transcriptional regulator [Stackebrandtia albiflava]TWJ14572.1 DNA-binding MarR family transcriptional regulator [Stackebrandtia albiflava]